MTRNGFIIAKALASFGLAPIERFRTAAAFEAHLLRDSEAVVGQLLWEETEELEEVTTEYWKLRKLNNYEKEFLKEIAQLEQTLEEAQDSRSQKLEEVAQVTSGGSSERDEASQKIALLIQERERCEQQGLAIKKSYSGLKTKLEVLLEEANGNETDVIKETRNKQDQKRAEFQAAKTRRNEIESQIVELQKNFESLSMAITKKNFARRAKAEEQMGAIGQMNRELTTLRNKIGQIDVTKQELYVQIGRYVIENSKDPLVRQASQKHRGLLNLIEKIRKSSYRHRSIVGI